MSTKSLSSSLPKIKIPFPPIIDLAELLQPNKSFSLFDEPHKPSRAPNAFIIYRKMFVKVAREEGHNLPMTAISSMASIAWEKEPERVKAEYKRISKEAHLKKKAMFPKDKKKRRKETWNVVSFQGPNLLKHYEINHDDDEELDEDSNDISVIINSDTNTTTTIYNNNYNHKKNNKNKNNDNNINNGSNNIDNNNNNSSSSNSSSSNHNSIDNNNNIYSNYYNNFYGSQFAIPAPIYSPETVELNLQNYSDSNNSSNNINNNNNLFKEKFENRGNIFDSNFPLDIRNDENLDDLLDSFLYNQQQQHHQQQHHQQQQQHQQQQHHHHQNYHQNDNQIQQMSYTMLLRQPITTTVDHDNNISLHQYIQLHHTPDLSSDESISGISSPSLSLNDAETVSSSNNNGFVYSDNNIFNIYSNEDNSNNNDDDNIFLNIISPDNNDNNNDKMFDTIDYHY